MTVKKTMPRYTNVCYIANEDSDYEPPLHGLRAPLEIMIKRKPAWTFVLSYGFIAPDGCNAADVLDTPIDPSTTVVASALDPRRSGTVPYIHVLDEYNEYRGSLWLAEGNTRWDVEYVYAYHSPRTQRATRTANTYRTTTSPKKAARDALASFRLASARELADDCITRCYSVRVKKFVGQPEMSEGAYSCLEKPNIPERHEFWNEDDRNIASLGEKALSLIEAYQRHKRSEAQAGKYQQRTRVFCTKASGSFVLARFGGKDRDLRSTVAPRWFADEAIRIPREAMPRDWAVRFARLAVSPAPEISPLWEVDVGVRTSADDFILHVPEDENDLWEELFQKYGEHNG
jgi:hypothetical protein